jgi:hypothetical protein
VGGACRKGHEPGDDVPDDSANESSADDINIHGFRIDQLVADGLCNPGPKEEGSDKVEKAAQRTAWSGDRTRVVTTVATELAASWKPLKKSNRRATAMRKKTK